MKLKFYVATLVTLFVLILTTHSQANDSGTPPSVSRRMIVCDGWQWIGHGATTWGCLYTPRETLVAGGPATDEVIVSLQKQIKDLEERLKKLESAKP